MKKLLSLFAIRRDERLMAGFFTLILTVFHALLIAKYAHIFMPLKRFYWPSFIHNFHISGFDPIPYSIISYWEPGYNLYRHPLLWLFYYPLYLLNQGLMALTGVNCAIFIIPFVQIFCSLYAFLFFYRLLKEVVQVSVKDAWLLSFMLFSFAYVLLAAIVPDHFINSLFCLVFTLYVAGLKMKAQNTFNKLETVLLFVVTAGISLNNGLKTFMATLFTNKRKFFQWRYLLLAVILPSAIIWGFCKWEYAQFVHPVEMAKKKAQAEKAKKEKQKMLVMNAQKTKKNNTKANNVNAKKAATTPQKKEEVVPIYARSFLRWTDISTPRLTTITENLFGEGIQLHSDYALGDVLVSRPTIVTYKSVWNYAVEVSLLLLWGLGLWCGRRSKLLQMVVCFWVLDMGLHLGLGFGIREIYIMTAHWAYIIPLSIAFSIKHTAKPYKQALRSFAFVLTLFLWAWNGFLTVNYLVQ